MEPDARRKSPEEYLRECEAEEQALASENKGHLKIFLGYASGVGKTFRMLDEARRRRERGQDIVAAAIQPQVPEDVKPLLQSLEVIPLKASGAIDIAAVKQRRPAACIVDGLAYDNSSDSQNPARWQDVQDLLDAGVQVIASINVQYVAELREQVEAITGKRVHQTVPLCFIQSAAEIEIVDAPPQAPLERSLDEAEHAEIRKHEERLSQLRELALVVTADIVDHQLNDYLERHGIRQSAGAYERILVWITPHVNLEEMMAFAQIIAKRFHGDLIAAYVRQPNISPDDRIALGAKLASATAAGARVESLEGSDAAETLLEFARLRGVTQLFVGRSRRVGLARLTRSPLDKLILEGHGIDVCVFPQ